MDDNNLFKSELNRFSMYKDNFSSSLIKKTDKNNSESIDDLIKNMESDQGLLNIIKNYQEYEIQKKQRQELEESGNEKLNIFSNYLIQSSLTKFNNLKRIVIRKENLIMIHYLDKWKINVKISKKELLNNKIGINSFSNDESDYLIKNRKVIEAYCEESVSISSDIDYLNLNTFNNHYDLPLQSNPNNKSSFYYIDKKDDTTYIRDNEEIGLKNPKIFFARILKNIFINKMKYYFSQYISKIQNYINSKKLANSSLSLLYVFTELAISKNKINKCTSVDEDLSKKNYIEELKQKLVDYEKKIAKYEASLNEKAEIIAGRNDRIEQQIETIELLTEEINRLNSTNEKLEKKCKNLNVINGKFINIYLLESLCAKCGNSLEESFMSSQIINSPRNKNDLKNTIQEQLEFILKMENENKELKIKNAEARAKNEMIINELEIIKSEFKQLSENLNTNKNNMKNINSIDNCCQTDNFSGKESTNSSSNASDKLKKTNSTITNSLKKSTKKFANKLNLKGTNSNSNSDSTSLKNITNYNIININTPNTSTVRSSQTNSSLTINMNESDKDANQSLRFDNSLLTQEIININKELTKIKNENKLITEINKKLEKEKTELSTKFKLKSENFDKIKKENEELMILIQTSNYKSFVNVEGENKKLKQDNINLSKENEVFKNEISVKDKKLSDLESELEKQKKTNDNLIKYKNDRENLILENAKFESEIKKLKYDLETSNNLIERQSILLKRQEDNINKLNEDFGYISFNAKKSKQEADKATQDILTYQQIVRKIEKELIETQNKKEKIETELNIIKQQFGIKK